MPPFLFARGSRPPPSSPNGFICPRLPTALNTVPQWLVSRIQARDLLVGIIPTIKKGKRRSSREQNSLR